MAKHQIQIQLTFPMGGLEGKRAHIQIVDSTSRSRVFEVDFNIEQYGELLSGSMVETEAEWRVHRLGWRMDTLMRDVFVPEGEWKDQEKRARAAVDAIIPDVLAATGATEAVARYSDASNSHRIVGRRGDKGTTYNVVFWIYFKPEGE